MSTAFADVSINGEVGQARASFDPHLERVIMRFRLLAKRRTAWLRKLWSEEGESGGGVAVTHSEVDTHLEGRDRPEFETGWINSHESVAPLNRQLSAIEAEMAEDTDSPLARLSQIFGLDRRAFDLLQACLAVSLDPSLRRVCAYLQDHAGRAYMTEELAARLYGGYGVMGFWNGLSPLSRWELLEERDVGPGEPSALACDTHIRDWLSGETCLDPFLMGIADPCRSLEPLSGWPINEAANFIDNVLTQERAAGVRVRIIGPPASGRHTMAAVISDRVGLPLLSVDCRRIDAHMWDRTWMRAQRQAYLQPCALAWDGEPVAGLGIWPRTVTSFPVQFLITDKDEEITLPSGFVDYRMEMPVLTSDERGELLAKLVPASRTWPQEKVRGFIEQHRLTIGQISAIRERDVGDIHEAAEVARESGRHRLGKLAQLTECPFNWDDLVVTDRLKEGLTDLLFEAKARSRFWERPEARRLYPHGRGLLALFSGQPGTGKTMAAQVIAADLGLDLFQIDLSTVVSKYVGETSQNLEQILSRATHMDAVLLFDEADALFGKRTEIKDAHDRFANTDTGYLLQAIENYQGLALLTTNKKGNIDPGFIRRIRYVFEFPKPDASQRLRIWERVVGELAGSTTLQAIREDLRRLSASVETTGAQIKFAVLAAIFAAQHEGSQLAVRHLLRGLDHEFAKEGRVLSDRERERLGGHG